MIILTKISTLQKIWSAHYIKINNNTININIATDIVDLNFIFGDFLFDSINVIFDDILIFN